MTKFFKTAGVAALLETDRAFAGNSQNNPNSNSVAELNEVDSAFPAPIDPEIQTLLQVSDLQNKLDAQATYQYQAEKYTHSYSGDSLQDKKYFKIITEFVAQMAGKKPLRNYDTSRVMNAEERVAYEDSILQTAIEIYKFHQNNEGSSGALHNIEKLDEMIIKNPRLDKKYGGAPELYNFLGDYFFEKNDCEMAMRLYSIPFSATKLPLSECRQQELYECKCNLGRYSEAELEIYRPKTLFDVLGIFSPKAETEKPVTTKLYPKASAKTLEVTRLSSNEKNEKEL